MYYFLLSVEGWSSPVMFILLPVEWNSSKIRFIFWFLLLSVELYMFYDCECHNCMPRCCNMSRKSFWPPWIETLFSHADMNIRGGDQQYVIIRLEPSMWVMFQHRWIFFSMLLSVGGIIIYHFILTVSTSIQ